MTVWFREQKPGSILLRVQIREKSSRYDRVCWYMTDDCEFGFDEFTAMEDFPSTWTDPSKVG